jgi:hypothetical protein
LAEAVNARAWVAALAVSIGWSTPAAAAAEATLCEEATRVATDLACAESARGIAMAGTSDRAQELLGLAESGADRFVIHFGRAPLPYAVVEGRSAVTPPETIDALRKAGFPVVLPWLSDAVYREQVERALRPAITAQMADKPPEQIEAAVAAGLTQQLDPARRAKVAIAAVPHELGHDWFRIGFWPDAALGEGQHYGGPSPDWLDEMSAVLMEPPVIFDERVAEFGKRYQSYRAAPEQANDNARALFDLGQFLKEAHPAAAQARAIIDQPSAEEKKSTVRLVTGDDARKIAEGGLRFYLQSAVVSQYLFDRTGDRAVLARVAEAFARGETIEQWLANAEPKGSLPRDLAAMQADWLVWLEARFPPG